MTRLAVLWVLAALLCANSLTFGQAFPNRPIRMVVPFAPGGSIDTVGRLIAQRWGANLNQQIVVDNRGGAGGTIGTLLVAKAPADGYTILYGNSGPLSIGPNLYAKPGYDLFRDLAPVSLVNSAPFLREDAESIGSSPEELARFLRSESAKWAKVIKTVGVKVE